MAFIWRIFSSIGLYTTCPYDADVAAENYGSGKPNDLDPIDVAKDCRLGVVRNMATEMHYVFGINAIKFLDDPTPLFIPEKEPSTVNNHRPTSERYAGHFDTLENCGILKKESGPSGLKFINGYFSVPKDDKVDRAILNGKVMSKIFIVPEPVNLQPISEFFRLLIWLVTAMIAESGQLFGFVLDLRHWFHQIKVGTHLSSFFGLHMGDSYYTSFFGLHMGDSYYTSFFGLHMGDSYYRYRFLLSHGRFLLSL